MTEKQVRETFAQLPAKSKQVLLGLLKGYSPAKIMTEAALPSEDALNQHKRVLYKKFNINTVQHDLDDKRSGSRKLPLLIALVLQYMPELRESFDGPKDTINRYEDWGDVDGASIFYGRKRELENLKQWIIKDECRLIVLLGIGGIGKTSLAIKLTEQIQDEFEYVILRSLKNAPLLTKILADIIKFLSNQQKIDLPEDLNDTISLLLYYLKQHRCLLILDNVEKILQEGDFSGRYREGYEGYGDLINRLGKVRHKSCLVLTSRENTKEIVAQEGETSPVRSLRVINLQQKDAEEILQNKGLSGSKDEFKKLIERYQGHPLALELVPSTIKKVCDGNISKFLELEIAAFINIRNLLEEQFNRLSDVEKKIMYWVGINREMVSLLELQEDIIPSVSSESLLEALESLVERSLINQTKANFTQQPVIMEYVTDKLINEICYEIQSEQALFLNSYFNSYALIKAQAKDYVREMQIVLILEPIIKLLTASLNKEIFELKLKEILSKLQQNFHSLLGYACGNIINILCQIQADLTGYDFSRVTIWQAFLRDVTLHNVNFAYSDLAKSVFTEAFGGIQSVAFSPDGKLLATGDAKNEIHLWQVADGTPLLDCNGHTSWVRSLAFSPDNQTLASGSDDQTVKFWNIFTGKCFKTWQENTGWVRTVSFSPDGQILAIGSEGGTVRLLNVNTGQCLQTWQDHELSVMSVAFSTDGYMLASGSQDKTVKLWNIRTGKCLNTLNKHKDRVRAVVFSPDGQMLASGSEDQTIILWNVQTGQCIKTLNEYNEKVWSLAFSSDGSLLSSSNSNSNDNHTVRLWDINRGQCIKTFQGHTAWIRSVAFSPDDKMLVSGGEDRTIRLWDINGGQCIKTLQGYTNRTWSVVFSPDGNTLASGSDDKIVRLWNIHTGECLRTLKGHETWVRSVAFSPDGQILASGSEDRTVKLWNTQTGKSLPALQGYTSRAWSVAFSPLDCTLASSSDDHKIRLWNVYTGECSRTLPGHNTWIRCVIFSPNGQILASCSDDKTVKLWNINTGKLLKILQGHLMLVWSIIFSPDGEILASCSDDKTVRLWNISTGELMKTLNGHEARVMSVAFSPDGEILASCGDDKTVRLWNISTGELMKTLNGHEARVMSVAFSPDGKTIASCSYDETIKIWHMKTDQYIKNLRVYRPYESINITGVKGLTQAQKDALKALGAFEK